MANHVWEVKQRFLRYNLLSDDGFYRIKDQGHSRREGALTVVWSSLRLAGEFKLGRFTRGFWVLNRIQSFSYCVENWVLRLCVSFVENFIGRPNYHSFLYYLSHCITNSCPNLCMEVIIEAIDVLYSLVDIPKL